MHVDVRLPGSLAILYPEHVTMIVRGGHTAQVACDKIYQVYGQKTVSEIITGMRPHERSGGHPELR